MESTAGADVAVSLGEALSARSGPAEEPGSRETLALELSDTAMAPDVGAPDVGTLDGAEGDVAIAELDAGVTDAVAGVGAPLDPVPGAKPGGVVEVTVAVGADGCVVDATPSATGLLTAEQVIPKMAAEVIPRSETKARTTNNAAAAENHLLPARFGSFMVRSARHAAFARCNRRRPTRAAGELR